MALFTFEIFPISKKTKKESAILIKTFTLKLNIHWTAETTFISRWIYCDLQFPPLFGEKLKNHDKTLKGNFLQKQVFKAALQTHSKK